MTNQNVANKLDSRHVIEALRCGVPNGEAVRALGCTQPHIEAVLRKQLLAAEQNVPSKVGSMLLKGGFGSGKSHTLEYLRRIALDSGFLCSKICVNKETPLYDAAKVFRAAIANAELPGKRGSVVAHLSGKLELSSDAYRDLCKWAESGDIDPRFAASLFLFAQSKTNFELRDRMVRFWSGDPMGISYTNSQIRLVAPHRRIAFSGVVPLADLALQRFEFITRLSAAAGYKGWVLLIDEVELIGCYGMFQRARSYIELARLMGQTVAFSDPRLIAILAITDDFHAAVLQGKGDLKFIAPALLNRSSDKDREGKVRQAQKGMHLISHEAVGLKSPGPVEIDAMYATVKAMHGRAYGWQPPEVTGAERLNTTRVREYIKRWITEWDMHRLYPDRALDIDTAMLTQNYSEDSALEGSETADTQLVDEILKQLR